MITKHVHVHLVTRLVLSLTSLHVVVCVGTMSGSRSFGRARLILYRYNVMYGTWDRKALPARGQCQRAQIMTMSLLPLI